MNEEYNGKGVGQKRQGRNKKRDCWAEKGKEKQEKGSLDKQQAFQAYMMS